MSLKGHVLRQHAAELVHFPKELQFLKPASESQKVHECLSCGKTFTAKSNLNNHIRKKHSNVKKKSNVEKNLIRLELPPD